MLIRLHDYSFSSFLTNFPASSWLCLQNELAILEFIHLLVETMDRHFGNVVSIPSFHPPEKREIKTAAYCVFCFDFTKLAEFSNFAVRAGHHVPFGESTFHAGRDGHEWLHR